jgi:hypothetical protein
MIKKAVLTLTIAPFLMVFSSPTYAADADSVVSSWCMTFFSEKQSEASDFWSPLTVHLSYLGRDRFQCALGGKPDPRPGGYGGSTITVSGVSQEYIACLDTNDKCLPIKTDEQCQTENSGTYSGSASAANYLSAGGSVKTAGGACSVSGTGGVVACGGTDDNVTCSVPIEASSTGVFGEYADGEYIESLGDGGTFSVVDFNTPEYLNELPGGCSDSSSCVTIGDKSYLVDWESAPDYFSYVDANGTTHSKPSSGGGGGDDGGSDNGGGGPTDPTDPTDPSDPGGDNGGDTGGDNGGGDDSDDDNDNGGSGGGSTVPDFEFDESGIIEAIRSSGQSNRNSIDALSNDVTREINDQTSELNAATSAQTESLNTTINDQTAELVTQGDRQTGRVTTAITSQTQSIQNTLDGQTNSLNSTLKGLEKSLVDAFKNITIRFSGGGGGGSSGGSDGEGDGDGEGEGEGDGIDGLFDSLVDKLASRFTEDLGDGNDLFDSSVLDETLDGVATQEQEYTGEVNALMDEIGEGDTSGIADQITSRLPSLPSGGCNPLQFGPMEISCQAFNTIKLWLTWIIYFWTVVSIVDTFFRSNQRTA